MKYSTSVVTFAESLAKQSRLSRRHVDQELSRREKQSQLLHVNCRNVGRVRAHVQFQARS